MCDLDQLIGLGLIHANDFGDFTMRKAFDRVQQQRFAAVVGQARQMPLRLGAGAAFAFFHRGTCAGPDTVQNLEKTRLCVYSIEHRAINQDGFQRRRGEGVTTGLAASHRPREPAKVGDVGTQFIADAGLLCRIVHLVESFFTFLGTKHVDIVFGSSMRT